MSVATPASRQVALFTTASFGPEVKKGHWYAKADGTQAYRMKGVPVFRSGEFRDSIGEQHTFDSIHMQMLSSNFSLLHNGAFPDPPIRCDHPGLFSGGGLDKVIGYVDNLSTVEAKSPVDGETYTYLLADFDVLDKDAAEKIDSGLWRHRSAEIGFYETNNGMEFWPVLVGFAYVDIPAVEGLNFSKYANALPGVGETFVAVAENQEEPSVADDNNKGDKNGSSTHSSSVTPPPPVAPAAPAPHVFKIAGQDSSDFAAVQAHIAKIEGDNEVLRLFQSETVESGRAAFIDSLATDGKIFASQVAGLQGLAKTLSDEQFAALQASYTDAPKLPALGNHFQSDAAGGTGEGVKDEDSEDPEVQKARRIVKQHTLAGKSPETILKTASGEFLHSKGLL